jgi:uncharacterized membrane protein YhiD involved in acid resistance
MPSDLELLGRLLLAAVLGGAVGAERELADQPAGLRTHMLLTMAPACSPWLRTGRTSFRTTRQDIVPLLSHSSGSTSFHLGQPWRPDPPRW